LLVERGVPVPWHNGTMASPSLMISLHYRKSPDHGEWWNVYSELIGAT